MVKFDLSDEGFIRIGTHYDQKDRCAAVPGGRWVPRLRMWEYLLTPSTASTICQAFHSEMNDEIRQQLQNYASRLSIARSVKNGDCELQVPVTSIDPWHHQLITYHMVRQLFGLDDEDDTCSAGAMAALDMGCGKSKCAVDIICNYPDKIRKVLIVCPMSVIDVWTGNEKRRGQFEIHTTKKQLKF